ncbi:two-component sensor histidine kinase [Paenibacillus donghaensis]|uniref:histidine kinase n=2 Tax=Paenibacillus donghaensis TaxID=414771 RepID=A0A2Z2KT89_9BACL|nr:two-component sensor histidine kinase [Paenibacillus donghaensis]
MLTTYIALLQQQLRHMNRQMDKRLQERTRQPLTLELINSELSRLTANINRCFQAEENLRLEVLREEKRFKELIANISHDLRTPLTAIKGYQQLMERRELTDEQRQKLQTAQKHADTLGTLIDHFFEYSYRVNAEPKLRLQRINLTNLVMECLAEDVALLEANKLAVHMEDTSPVYAMVDHALTVRIIQNLIRNGATHAAGDIEVEVRGAAEHAVILFSNPVANVAELETGRLFERFYTGNQARNGSTGLGLSIVKLLAEQLDGSASASLQDGRLEIRVELPVASPSSNKEVVF